MNVLDGGLGVGDPGAGARDAVKRVRRILQQPPPRGAVEFGFFFQHKRAAFTLFRTTNLTNSLARRASLHSDSTSPFF